MSHRKEINLINGRAQGMFEQKGLFALKRESVCSKETKILNWKQSTYSN